MITFNKDPVEKTDNQKINWKKFKKRLAFLNCKVYT